MSKRAREHRGSKVWVIGCSVVGVALLANVIGRIAPTFGDSRTSFDVSEAVGVAVTIETMSHVFVDRFGNSDWTVGTGSGVLVSSERCEIWTNHHVVDDAAFVEAHVHGDGISRTIPAKVVGSVVEPDVAVLQLEHCDGIVQARLGNSDVAGAGDTTYAVGNPFGANPKTLTRGIVSHTRRYVEGVSTYLQTDAAIGLGSSGGPLFNEAGEVIGLNVGVAVGHASLDSGFGYAIPINEAARAVRQILSGSLSNAETGLTGLLREVDPPSARLLGVKSGRSAVVVSRTPTDGPALGRLFARDVILQVDEKAVSSAKQADRLLAAYESGESLEMTVIRDGKEITAQIEIAQAQVAHEPRTEEFYEGLLGMDVAYWGGEQGELGQYKNPVVTRIYDLGPAHRARLRASKRSARARGPVLAKFLLDVRMVTGAVLEGKYVSVPDKAALETIAVRAHRLGRPLLLEIASWRPKNPNRPGAGMTLHGSTLHRVMPTLAGGVDDSREVDTSTRQIGQASDGEA